MAEAVVLELIGEPNRSLCRQGWELQCADSRSMQKLCKLHHAFHPFSSHRYWLIAGDRFARIIGLSNAGRAIHVFSSPGTYDCRQVNCRHHRQILLFLLGRLVESMKADLTSLLVWYENVRNHSSTEQSTHHVELTACS